MDRIDPFHERVDILEQQTAHLCQQTRRIERRLRWWRGLACSLVVLVVLTWALPSGTAQEDDSERGRKGLVHRVAAVEKLLKHFKRDGNEVIISGANLHTVNGLGSTDCTDAQGEESPDCPTTAISRRSAAGSTGRCQERTTGPPAPLRRRVGAAGAIA